MATSLIGLRRFRALVVAVSLATGLLGTSPASAINEPAKTNSTTVNQAVIRSANVSPSPAPNAAPNPPGYPGTPQRFALTRGNSLAKVTWLAPQNNGEPAVTSYVISASLKGKIVKSLSVRSSLTTTKITGLTNGLTYSVSIRAKNSVGLSPVAKTLAIVPSTISPKAPSAPVFTLVDANSRAANLKFRWGSDNGSTITGVEYSVNYSSSWTLHNSLTLALSLTDLANGIAQNVRMRAINSIGKSNIATATFTPTANQNSINFTQPSEMKVGDTNQPLVASAPGGTTTFVSQTRSVCSIAYGAIHAIAVGTCTVLASNTGNVYYQAAQSVSRSLQISKGVTPTPTSTPSPTPTPTSPEGELLWSEEFNGSSSTALSSSTWDVNVGDGCAAPYNNCGWGNGEKQYYLANANKLDGDGNLVITAKRTDSSDSRSCYYGKCAWTSGKVTTQDKVLFTYGYIEARIQSTGGGGTWPAFWMLGNDIKTNPWPGCGEIDIMESEGNQPYTNWMTIHRPGSIWGGNSPIGTTKTFNYKLSDGFHNYGIMWTPTSIEWRIDGVSYFTVNRSRVGSGPWPFGENDGKSPKFYVIANVAMGGNMGGVIDAGLQSDSLKIDWIRYTKVDGYGAVTYLP